jgi:hypothetical protein
MSTVMLWGKFKYTISYISAWDCINSYRNTSGSMTIKPFEDRLECTVILGEIL